jgi:hypothetical protein
MKKKDIPYEAYVIAFLKAKAELEAAQERRRKELEETKYPDLQKVLDEIDGLKINWKKK